MNHTTRQPLLKRLLVVLAGWLALYALSLSAEPLQLDPNVHDYPVTSALQVLRDPQHRFSIDELLQGTAHGQWQPLDGSSTPNFGLTQDTIWLRLPVAQQLRSTRWLLEMSNPLLDQVDFHLVRNGRVVERFITGDHYPFAQRPRVHRHLLFPLDLETEGHYEIWLRVESSSTMNLGLHLWQPDEFWKKDQPLLLGYGFFHGMLMLFSLYYLFMLLWTRERSHLYFALFSLSSGLTVLTIHGLGTH